MWSSLIVSLQLAPSRGSSTTITTSPPRPTPLAAGSCSSAAGKRARRKAAHSAWIAKNFEERIAAITRKWQLALKSLHVEQNRRRIATKEHKALSEEVARFREQDRAELQQLELRRSCDFNAAKAAHQAAIKRLEDLHRLALARSSAKHEAELGALRLERDRLLADVARIRGDRERFKTDSLRYNAERNEARRKLIELQARQSSASLAARVSAPFFEK